MDKPFSTLGAVPLDARTEAGSRLYAYDAARDVNVLVDRDNKPTDVPACEAFRLRQGNEEIQLSVTTTKTAVQKEGDVPDRLDALQQDGAITRFLAGTTLITEVKKEGDRPDRDVQPMVSGDLTATLLAKTSVRTFAGQEGDRPDPSPFPR